MGIGCQITRIDNEIVNVEAVNGFPSNLFSELSRITKGDKQKALDLYAISYTNEFKAANVNAQVDENNEVGASTVLKYIQNLNTNTLSPAEIISIQASLLKTPINNLETISLLLKPAFYTSENVFAPSRESLTKSKLFTNSEITRILNSKKLRKQIHATLTKLSNTESALGNIKGNDLFTVKSAKVSPIGKEEYLNPYIVEKEVVNELIGINDMPTFTNTAAFNKYVGDLVKTNTEYASSLMQFVSGLDKIPVMEYKNGNLVAKTENDIYQIFNDVLVTGNSNFRLSHTISVLNSATKNTWSENREDILTLLKAVETYSLDHGIDIPSLDKIYEEKTQKEITEFITKLDDFTSLLSAKAASKNDVRTFANVYQEFFNITPTEKTVVRPKSDLSLVSIETEESPTDVFNNISYLHIKDSLYQKIDKESQNVMDMLPEIVSNDQSVFPQAAFYPGAFDVNNNFDSDRITQDVIENDVMVWIKRKAAELDITPEMLVYKLAFGHPLTPAVEQEVSFSTAVTTNELSYLSGKFLADFYIHKVIEKRKNSDEYLNLLQHFDVESGRIVLKNSDPISKNNIQLSLDESNEIHTNLKKYTQVVKDRELNKLFESENNLEGLSNAIPVLRSFYFNNPKALSEHVGQVVETDESFQVPNVVDNFIKVKGVVMEKVGESGNMSFYNPILGFTDPIYNIVSVSVASPIKFKLSRQISTEASDGIDVTPLMSSREKNEIDETLARC